MHYYNTYSGTMGIFSTVNILCSGTKHDAGNNVLPSFIISTSPNIKIRRITGEYRSNTKNCALLTCLAQPSIRVHVEVWNG